MELIANVVEELKNGKCVLFLGPELLISDGEEKYYKIHFKELAAKNPSIVYKYFAKDNVFSLLNAGNTNDNQVNELAFRNVIKNFYETAGDQGILNLIAQLPFPLIVNVAADNAINRTFDRNNFPYTGIHFPDPDNQDIKKPTIAHPVIYNIFGSIQEKRSIVLTHEELFKRIKLLMQKNTIPPEIEKAIRTANSYIFLGMKFETWYYQLLLSIFDIEISKSVKLLAPRDIDEDTVSIMDKYFQIGFAKLNPMEFIGTIYDQLKTDSPASMRHSVIQTSTSAYISYAWNDQANNEREKWVLRTEADLKAESVNVLKDKNELTLQDSIQAFMNRIGKGRVILMVISDKYLRSENCMYEAWSVFKNDNFNDRAFVIILPDVDLSDKEQYIKFWQGKTNEIRRKIEEEYKNDHLALSNYMEKHKSCLYILLFINQFLTILSDVIYTRIKKELTEQDVIINEKGYQLFIDKVKSKLRQL